MQHDSKTSVYRHQLCAMLAGLLLALAAPAIADNIYKYQDENGIWHFTDRAPQEGTEFETVYMERERENRITLRQGGTKFRPLYYAFNDYHGPAQLELSLGEDENVLSEPDLPARFTVPGQKEELLVGLEALDPRRGFRYRLMVNAVPGPPVPEPVTALVVDPPFSALEAYPVSQGFNGESTHTGDENRFAVDIAMPENTPVHAARAGIVMDIEEDFNQGGTDVEKYADKANHVRILHDDGTMALYAHLALAGVRVASGARVRAGQLIGRSGNTGFSSGPHLHFVIQQNVGMKLISLPFEFRRPDGSSAPPREGTFIGNTPDNR